MLLGLLLKANGNKRLSVITLVPQWGKAAFSGSLAVAHHVAFHTD